MSTESDKDIAAELDALEALLDTTAVEPVIEPEEKTDSDDEELAIDIKSKGPEVKTFLDYVELQQDLIFDAANISEAFQTQASIYAHYSSVKAKAVYQSDRFETEARIIKATVYEKIREDYASKGKKTTEGQLDNKARIHPKVVAANQRANEAKAISDLCWSALESLKQRRDMLVQSGFDMREQRKGELVLRESSESSSSPQSVAISRARDRLAKRAI